MKKYFIVIASLLWFIGLFWSVSAEDYRFFYGNWCTHCAKVEQFFDKNNIVKIYDVIFKEVYFDRDNLNEFMTAIEKLDLDSSTIGVPFLLITSGSSSNYLNWDIPIIDYFTQKLADSVPSQSINSAPITAIINSWTNTTWVTNQLSGTTDQSPAISLQERLSFFAIMLPAALSDSINPCAFAVMLLLLSSILSKYKSRKKTLLAWWLFALAVFLTYLAMGIWLFSALASATNTTILKIVVWSLGILVGLANLKDYFWYWKWFVMEVPFSWRPKMAQIIESVSSPLWVFFVGIVVSIFLLPCSSGPYFTILWYLSSQTKELTNRWYLYLIIYNLIFVIPMLVITALVWFGYSSVDKLAKLKHNNTKLIHLIVGLLMLGLGAYIFITL